MPLLAKKSTITIVRGFDDWPNMLTPGQQVPMWPSAVTFQLSATVRDQITTIHDIEVRGRLIMPSGAPDLGADYVMSLRSHLDSAPGWIRELIRDARTETAEWAT